MSKFLILVSSILTANLFAAEVDQFTIHDKSLTDQAPLINKMANEAIKSSIEARNAAGKGCVEKDLYKELRLYFGNHIKGKFSKEIIESKEIERRSLEIKDSVYRDWNSFDGLLLGNPLFKKSKLSLSESIRVGEMEIGTDKFEHMFGRGFTYFTKHYLKGQNIESTLRYGINQEKIILGGLFLETGVFSYGDLTANFNGMRFWNHMLLKNDDILGAEYNLGPYIACENNQWVQKNLIDFTKYIDLAFNESKNCSKFVSKKSTEKFKNRVSELGGSCGFTSDELSVLENKYGKFSSWILNSEGNMPIRYLGEYGDSLE